MNANFKSGALMHILKYDRRQPAVFYTMIIQALMLNALPANGDIKGIFDFPILVIYGALSVFNVLYYIKGKNFKTDKTGVFLIVFYAICAASAVYALTVTMVPFKDVLWGFYPFLYFIYYFIFRNYFDNMKMSAIADAIIITGCVYSGIIFVYFIIYYPDLYYVTSFDRNAWQICGLTGCVLAWSKYFKGRSLPYLIASVFCLFGTLLTGLRSLQVAMVASLIFMLVCTGYQNKRVRRAIVSVTLISICALCVLSLLVMGQGWRWTNALYMEKAPAGQAEDTNGVLLRIGDTVIKTSNPTSVGARFKECAIIIDMVKDTPITGMGLGYKIGENSFNVPKYAWSHNIFFYTLLNSGLVGVVFLVVFLAYILARFASAYRRTKNNPTERNRVVPVFSCIVGIFIYNNFFPSMHSIKTVFIVSFLLAAFSLVTGEISAVKAKGRVL